MTDPISVTIKELKGQARNLNWCAKGNRWIEAGSTITLDYEPWSCADRKQKESIRAELGSKRVSLTLHVLSADGLILDIPYDPSLINGNVVPAKPAENNPMLVSVSRSLPEDKRVIVGKSNVEVIELGFKAEEVVPPQAVEKTKENAVGFTRVEPPPASGAVAEAEKKAAEVVEPAELVEVAAVVVEPAEHIRNVFIQCVENKQWDAALEVLKAAFGDQITFTVRTIMSMKDYDAIVEKYNLK